MSTRRAVIGVAIGLAAGGVADRGRALAAQATPAAGDEPIEVPVILKEFEVNVLQRVFVAGQAYTFVVTNEGKIPHEFVIEERASMDVALESGDNVAEVQDIKPGTSASLTWTFDEPGEYKVDCHVPGHYEAGMVTPIQVIEEAQRVELVTTEFAIAVDATEVKLGVPVAFLVTNKGKLVHEVVVQPAGKMDEPFETDDADGETGSAAVSEIEDIDPGSRRELIWTFDTPGKLDIACHVEGHYEAGMVASLEVIA